MHFITVFDLIPLIDAKAVKIVDIETGAILTVGIGTRFPAYIQNKKVLRIFPNVDDTGAAFLMIHI